MLVVVVQIAISCVTKREAAIPDQNKNKPKNNENASATLPGAFHFLLAQTLHNGAICDVVVILN